MARKMGSSPAGSVFNHHASKLKYTIFWASASEAGISTKGIENIGGHLNLSAVGLVACASLENPALSAFL